MIVIFLLIVVLCFKQFMDGCFLDGCLLTLNKSKKVVVTLLVWNKLKKTIVILLSLDKSKNSSYFADFEEVKKFFAMNYYYHSLPGSVAKWIKRVPCIKFAFREESLNPAGIKHFVKINVA